MPVQIGAHRESGFDNPIGLLTDCHRRIEMFLGVLVKLSEQLHGGALNPDQAAALQRALDYFQTSGPRHTADEEDSLFPRMRAEGSMRTALEKIENLHREHQIADEAHAEIETLGRQWLTGGTLPAAESEKLANRLRQLQDLYREHITMEEQEVFPVASAHFSASQTRQIGEEMAARRKPLV